MVSVNDLHRGLSSFAFRVKQITQNPVLATGCGFDPRRRHHNELKADLLIKSAFNFFIDFNNFEFRCIAVANQFHFFLCQIVTHRFRTGIETD